MNLKLSLRARFRRLALVLSAPCVAVVGCSSSAHEGVGSNQADLTSIPASEATQRALGVYQWMPVVAARGAREFRGVSAAGEARWVMGLETADAGVFGDGDGQELIFTKHSAGGGYVRLHVGADKKVSVGEVTMARLDASGLALLAADLKKAQHPTDAFSLTCPWDAIQVAVVCGADAAALAVTCGAECATVAGCVACVGELSTATAGFLENCGQDVVSYVADGCPGSGGGGSCTPRACNDCGIDNTGNWSCTGPCGSQPDGCGGTVDCGSCGAGCTYHALNFANDPPTCEAMQTVSGQCVFDDGTGRVSYCNQDGSWTNDASALSGGNNQNSEVTLCHPTVDCPGGPGCP